MLMCLYSCKGGYPLLLFGCLESFEHLSRYTQSCKLNTQLLAHSCMKFILFFVISQVQLVKFF